MGENRTTIVEKTVQSSITFKCSTWSSSVIQHGNPLGGQFSWLFSWVYILFYARNSAWGTDDEKSSRSILGIHSFLIFLFCIVFVRLVETTTENRLENLHATCWSVPHDQHRILLLWLNTRKTISVHRNFFVFKIVSIFLIAAVTLTGLFIMGFSH